MRKRLAYEASPEAELALAEPGRFGFKSRNAMINAAILQLAGQGAQDGAKLYQNFVKRLVVDIQATRTPEGWIDVDMLVILNKVIALWDAPKRTTDAIEILHKRYPHTKTASDTTLQAQECTTSRPDVF